MSIENLRAQLASEQDRYDELVSKAAGVSLKPGELDAWTLARHAHQNIKQLRAQITALESAVA